MEERVACSIIHRLQKKLISIEEIATHQAEFDASKLASGMYIYRIHVLRSLGAGGQAGDFVQSKKMLLMK